MKKMKKLLSFLLSVSLMLALAACGGAGTSGDTGGGGTSATEAGDAASDGEVIYISMAHGSSEETAQHQAMVAMKEYIEEKSGGKMQVTIYPNNQMGANREATEAVMAGNVTMMMNSTATMTSFIPDCAIYDVPFAFADEAAIDKTIQDKDLMELLNARCQEMGLTLLMQTQSSFRQLSCNKDVHTPADLKGLTIRVQENEYQIATWQALGANATPLAFNELYTALQQGTVDGQENPVELFVAQKFYEQQDYLVKTNHLGYIGMWIINSDFYNGLSEENRQILQDACEVGLARNNEYSATSIAEKEAFLSEQGTTVTTLTAEEQKAFKDLTADVWNSIESNVSPEVWAAFEATLS